MDKVDKERNQVRKEQIEQAMPLIAKLLNEYEYLPNDLEIHTDPEYARFREVIFQLRFVMDKDE